MYIFPAIDVYDGKVVRLIKGDYGQMTVYSEDPAAVARSFREAGAQYLHCVDLQGARDGGTPNFETIQTIISQSGLRTQVGGGIRSPETIEKYLDAGAARVILGTAAVTEPLFLEHCVEEFCRDIAVGVDIKDGMVAVKGWTQTADMTGFAFCRRLSDLGVKTVICTDIAKDGMLGGTNLSLYRELSAAFHMDIIASGGVSTTEDIKNLASLGLYGAILGKALYTKAIDLSEAIQTAKGVFA